MTIRYAKGNLLDAQVDALVNTVNTVGVMGKGVALMFREQFPENYAEYAVACKDGAVRVGSMFVTERKGMFGPRWIINFPTKQHWRYPSKLEWIAAGLDDLKHVIAAKGIKSIALPPLGAGNGGLDWAEVRELIADKLRELPQTEVVVYEPTAQYQNVAKREGVEKLTPPRALIAELVRRYSIVGIECSLLEVQKLGYFLERFSGVLRLGPLRFEFKPNKYGPFSDKLRHMLNSLDGSYLHCEKRLSDAGPFEPMVFDPSKREFVAAYLTTKEAKAYRPALEATSELIDGFESPLGMELLATVDWLTSQERVPANVAAIKESLKRWPGGTAAAKRKAALFEDRLIDLAIVSLSKTPLVSDSAGQEHA